MTCFQKKAPRMLDLKNEKLPVLKRGKYQNENKISADEQYF